MTPETLGQLFLSGIERYPRDDRFLVPREGAYEPVSSDEFLRQVQWLAEGLSSLGIRPGDRIALASYNRLEWALVDYAAACLGAVIVPMYTSLSQAQVEFILKDCGAKAVIVEDEAQAAKVLRVRDAVESIRLVLVISGRRPDGAGSLEEVLQLGRSLEARAFRTGLLVRPGDLATILYTSGTTGTPKGVMLSHSNLVSNALSNLEAVSLSSEDVVLSMLPLSHVFERTTDYAAFWSGASVAYPTKLEEAHVNMRQVRPTVMAVVPRFLEKFRARELDRVKNAWRPYRALYDWARSVGLAYARFRLMGQDAPTALRVKFGVADALLLASARSSAGGRLRLFLSGGAALSLQVAEFIVSLGFTVAEGYGLTETSPVVSVNPPARVKLGTAGRPVPGVDVKIDADGEILVRGPNVMMGYYGRPEETAQAMSDGWFRTGDIGSQDADGYLSITDRKKDLFKTSGGNYVAPGPIESKLRECPLVSTAVVVGENRRFPACLVFVNEERLIAAGAGPGGGQVGPGLLESKKIFDLIQGEIDRINSVLSSPERIKKFALLKDDLSTAGELTPTMKVRRRMVAERFRHVIDELYREEEPGETT